MGTIEAANDNPPASAQRVIELRLAIGRALIDYITMNTLQSAGRADVRALADDERCFALAAPVEQAVRQHALELGRGTGLAALRELEAGFQAAGCDVSEALLENASILDVAM